MNIIRKFWRILDKQYKLLGLRLVVITVIGAFFEAVGVALIIPFVSIIFSEDFILPEIFIKIWPYLENLSKNTILISSVLGFLLFYLAKSAFLLWLAVCQANYYYGLEENISVRIFRSYLSRNYAFHLKTNSGKLLSNTMTESQQFATGFTASFLLALNDILIIILILIVLFIAEPGTAIIAFFTFGIMSFLLFNFSRKRASLWGETRQQKERQRIKSAQQGFGGVKDVKLYNREDFFVNEYFNQTKISLDAGKKQTILQNIPRNFFELIAVSTLCSIILFLVLTGNQSKAVGTISLFSVAAFKLLPTISRLIHSLQGMVFTLPVVSLIYRELVEAKERRLPENEISKSKSLMISFKKNILLSNLCFNYEGVKKPTLDTINLSIEAGKMIGFFGPSGSGKSTLIDCLLLLLKPVSGDIRVDGELITAQNVNSWQKQFGYVSQVIYLLDASLRENISFGIPFSDVDEKKIQNALKKSQLSDLVSSLPEGLDTVIGEHGVRLSGGQRQRIGIARALYNDPPMLILDEATSALDISTESEVMKAVQDLRGDKTILIVAHRLSTIKNCDYLYQMKDGKIISKGKPKELIDV